MGADRIKRLPAHAVREGVRLSAGEHPRRNIRRIERVLVGFRFGKTLVDRVDKSRLAVWSRIERVLFPRSECGCSAGTWELPSPAYDVCGGGRFRRRRASAARRPLDRAGIVRLPVRQNTRQPSRHEPPGGVLRNRAGSCPPRSECGVLRWHAGDSLSCLRRVWRRSLQTQESICGAASAGSSGGKLASGSAKNSSTRSAIRAASLAW